jgi:hypothetical protein
MRAFAFALALLSTCAAASAQEAAPAPAASAAVDQTMLATAKDWFHRLQTGDIDHSALNDNANMSLDADSVKELTAQVAPLGNPLAFVQKAIGTLNGNTSYTYELTFKNGAKIGFVLLVDGNGKIAGISVQN